MGGLTVVLGWQMKGPLGGPVEPHGDIREGAASTFQFYVAYRQAGFNEDQAMTLVAAMVAAMIHAGGQQQQGQADG